MSFGLTKEKVVALFKLAEFRQVDEMYTLVNEYWPDAYKEMSAANPWFLVKTPCGLIKIGPRKRVIEIDWSDTKLREKPPELTAGESITKSETLVHCWDMEQVSKRLLWLRVALEAQAAKDALCGGKPLPERFRLLLSKLRYDSKRLNHPLSGEQIGIAVPSEVYREIAALDDDIFDVEKGRVPCPQR